MAKTQNQQKTGKAAAGKGKKFKKRERKNVPFGLVFIQASFNNTIVTITDQVGNTLSWKSSGSLGFRGSARELRSPRNRPLSVQPTQLATTAYVRSMCASPVPGSGRESAIRALATTGIEVRSIRDVTPMPHNGCRPPKRRRV